MSDDIEPWCGRTLRWGRPNLTEAGPARYGTEFWRQRWRVTKALRIIVNTGGVVAHYPSRFPQHRTTTPSSGDLYERPNLPATRASWSSRAWTPTAPTKPSSAHPEWFTRDENDAPYKAGPDYVACTNCGYYRENCVTAFRASTGAEQPSRHDRREPVYDAWMGWNVERGTEVWAESTRVASAAGGPDRVWAGMISGRPPVLDHEVVVVGSRA